MNIYRIINEIVFYIENNLEEKIDYKIVAKKAGISVGTLQNIFSLVTNVGIAEYIRNRRLSNAYLDLRNGTSVMDVAIKYQYNSAVAFSRSFYKFYGVKPGEVKKSKIKLKTYPILNFDENNHTLLDMSYRIEEKDEFTIYGVKKDTNEDDISRDAPKFYNETYLKYNYGHPDYGMVVYENRFKGYKLEYWVLYKENHSDLVPVCIPKSKWLIFKSDSLKSRDIQNLANNFYDYFIEKNNYIVRDLPELEVYYKDYMEFMVPIE